MFGGTGKTSPIPLVLVHMTVLKTKQRHASANEKKRNFKILLRPTIRTLLLILQVQPYSDFPKWVIL